MYSLQTYVQMHVSFCLLLTGLRRREGSEIRLFHPVHSLIPFFSHEALERGSLEVSWQLDVVLTGTKCL